MNKLLLEYCISSTVCVFTALFVGLFAGYLIGSKWYKEKSNYNKGEHVHADKVYFINVDDLRRDKCQD